MAEPDANPFSAFDPDKGGLIAAPAPANDDNPFSQFGEQPVAPPTGTVGAFAHAAERGVVPAAGVLAGAGAGAETGGAIGAFGGPFGAAIGAFAGGVIGGFGGGYAAGEAQDYALSKAPDTWKEAIGQDDRQQRLEAAQHPYASFLGGLAPYALTMQPGAIARGVLPANATALQRILANPVTARVFGGAAMGGMELGQEKVAGEPTDWSKVAIATGFGLVFNKPTRLGQAIEGLGARPFRRVEPLAPEAAPAPEIVPLAPPREEQEAFIPQPDLAGFEDLHTATIAQAGDAKVMGPGVTEEVFQGAHEQDTWAEMVLQENARVEQDFLGTSRPPDIDAAARRLDPDAFEMRDMLVTQRDLLREELDRATPKEPRVVDNEELLSTSRDAQDAERNIVDLTAQRNKLRGKLNNLGEGGLTDEFMATSQRLQELNNQLHEAVIQRNRLRGRLMDLSIPAPEPRLVDNEQMLAISRRLQEVQQRLWETSQDVAAARRRALDAVGGEAAPAEPHPAPRVAEAPAAPTAENVIPIESQTKTLRTIEQQRGAIEDDVRQKLLAAGRPADEAEASAKLTSALYETHAERMGGKTGTAEEIYRREAPSIRAGRRAKQPEMAQGKEFNQLSSSGELVPVGDRAKLFGEMSIPEFRSYIQNLRDRLPEGSLAHRTAGDELGNIDRSATDRIGVENNGPWYPPTGKAKESIARDIHQLLVAEYNRLKSENEHGAYHDLRPFETALGTPVERESRTLEQTTRGKIRFDDGRAIITLMRDANASTYVHEIGHDWLERLMRDAGSPDAVESVKTDAATIRKWAGFTPEKPTVDQTKAHEKFARGFEQYLREGIAPSMRLASVFAKLRNWLTEIYQTIKGLGAPINEDIRGVFDRMLSTAPQRTVIHEDIPGGPSLADIHAADARETEPHEAGPAADRIDAERARAAVEPPEEIAHEIAEAEGQFEVAASGEGAAGAEPAAEAPGGAAGHPEVDRGSGQSKPESNRVSVGAGAGQERAGVGAAAPEGDSVRGGERRTGGPQSQPLAPTPATLFGAESPFVDKAGNIRVENLTTSQDVAQAIHDAAEANNDFIGDRRGVITDGQVMDLADALGMDVSRLNQRAIGQAFNAEQIVAARKLLIQSATDVSVKMKTAAIGSDEDVLAYALAKDRHQMIQAQVAGITAEAGRALRAFRSLAGEETAQATDEFIRTATGKTLYQLKQEAKLGSALDTPGKVSKFLADAQKRTFGRMVLEYWINGLISGPATHATYAVGNTILAINKAVLETPAAAASSMLRNALGREGQTIRLGEVGARLAGGARGLAGGVEAALEATKTGMTTLLPGEKARPLTPFQGDAMLAIARSATNDQVKWTEVGAQTFGLFRGLMDGLVSGAALLKAGGVEGAPLLGWKYSPLGQIPDLALRGVRIAPGLVPGGTMARLPSRGVAAIHSFFRSVNYSMEKSAIAYRTAANEGLEGTAFDARVAGIRQNPEESVMEASRHEATELTLMGKGSEFVQALGRLTNTNILGFPILKFIDPFVHIAGNIIDQSIIHRTPVGLLSPEIRADLSGRNGNVAQDTATARMLVGTALSVTFGGLAASGLISGSGPADPKQAAMWRLAGNQAHSFRVGDTWYQGNRLGPMGMLMGIAADLYDVAHTAGKGEFLTAASMLQHAFTQNVLDESFMRGPAELIQAIEDPGRYGEAYLRNFVSSFVPYSVGLGQIDRATDPYSRQARTVADAIRAKVPGLSESLYPRRDIWGEPMPNHEALIAKGLTAIYESQMSRDPVNIAMVNLGMGPAQIERKIRNVELTDGQYDDFSRIAGRMTKMRLDAIVRSPDFQAWPSHIRADVINETIKQSREAARGMMLMKYPSIAVAATKAKRDKLLGEP